MEFFKDIPWYEWFYKVSNLGNIKSLARKKWIPKQKIYCKSIEKILKSSVWKKWYSTVSLSKHGVIRYFSVHRLVAEWFLDFNINSKLFVLHKKEDLTNWRLDNSYSNLWVWTWKDNMQDCSIKWRCGHQWKIWKLCPSSKKVAQLKLNWTIIKTWDATMDIQRELWYYNQWISLCCLWKRKQAFWFIWKYV